jgi:hypothetical protein
MNCLPACSFLSEVFVWICLKTTKYKWKYFVLSKTIFFVHHEEARLRYSGNIPSLRHVRCDVMSSMDLFNKSDTIFAIAMHHGLLRRFCDYYLKYGEYMSAQGCLGRFSFIKLHIIITKTPVEIFWREQKKTW